MVRDKMFYGGLALLLLVLIGADFLYFSALEEPTAPEPVATQAPAQSDPATPAQDVTCFFDETKEAVADYAALINPEDPVYGNENADITLIEYFDPNCPHCKHLHPVMDATLDAYGDRIRVVYKPVALPGWTRSVPQVSALWSAAEDDKFKEMLAQQFAMQKQGGLSVEELKGIASEIGMDVAKMEQQIEDGTFNDRMMATMQQVREIGMTGVPAVLLNGRFIAPSSRTEACFAQLVESSLAETG